MELNDPSIHYPSFAIASFWEQSWLPGMDFESGFSCYDGTFFVQAVPDQAIYRLKAVATPGDRAYKLQIAAFTIKGERVLTNAHPRSPFAGGPLEKICGGRIVQGQFIGDQGSIDMTVLKSDENSPTPIDVILGESATDLHALTSEYGPMLKRALAASVDRSSDLPFYGSDAYNGIDAQDPIALLMAATKEDEKKKDP